MTKAITWIVIVLVVVLGAYFLLPESKNTPDENNIEKTDEMMNKDDQARMIDSMEKTGETMEEADKMMSDDKEMEAKEVMVKAGSYEAYNESKLTKANTGDVVLFFRASWCPTCRTLDADIKANLENIPADLTILDVDYDNSSDLKQKYGVTYQHTLVQVDSSGKLIKKWSGSRSLTALVGQVE